MESDQNDPQISRRKLIKRAGVVGAVAWTAPVVESLVVPASAGVSAPPANPDQSLSLTRATLAGTWTKDATSAASANGCAPAGYTPGQASTYGASGSGGAASPGNENATITITGLPSNGTCTVRLRAECAGTGICSSEQTATKAAGMTSVSIGTGNFQCGAVLGVNQAILKAYVFVDC